MSERMRRGLDRKAELELYEWLKENYSQLAGKTAAEGAAFVSSELSKDISASSIIGMCHTMGLIPFWHARVKVPKPANGSPEAEALASDTGDLVGSMVGKMQSTLVGHAKAIMQAKKTLNQINEICTNLVQRIEALEEK